MGKKIADFDWPKLSISGLELQFEFTNDFEMMHKAWHNTEEVPYCFSRSSNFQGHMDKKLPILTGMERSRTVTPVWIHRWLLNDAQSLV